MRQPGVGTRKRGRSHDRLRTARAERARAHLSSSSSPAARAAARRAALPSISIRAWTTSRRCCRRRPARSSTTARRCASRFPERSPIGGLKEDAAVLHGKGSGRAVRRHDPRDGGRRAASSAGTSATRSTASRATTLAETARGSCSSGATSRPPSFHQESILKYPDGQIFDVITNGTGLMPAYRWPIPAADRWAIVAYVRDLQRKRLARAPSASTSPNAPAEPTSAKSPADKPAGNK